LAALSSETSLIVPKPVANRHRSYVTQGSAEGVPQMRHCVVFHWVYGRFQRRNPRPVHLERTGVTTAILHRHAQTYDAGAQSGFIDVEWGGGMRDIWDKGIDQDAISAEDRPIFEQVRKITSDALDSLGTEKDAYGLIHGDLHLGNVFFADGAANVIDFDDCGFGHYLNDLAITLWYLRGRPDFDRYRDALLEGYVRGGGVVSAEKFELLDTLNASRSILMALYIAGRTDHPQFRAFASRYTHALADDLRRFLTGKMQVGARWG
jgi:Ser/Thr protein kinase RdoA (MazF antagonist)